jgi:hypothetical protein
MSISLLKRRLVIGPVFGLGFGYLLWLYTDSFAPTMLIGGLLSIPVGVLLIRSERRAPRRMPITPPVWVIAGAAFGVAVLLRFAARTFLIPLCVVGFALFLAIAWTAAYELLKGTYVPEADQPQH